MKLNKLEKLLERSKKRVGRGTGSGKGKTGGRGMKGQKARGKIPAAFVGGSLPLYKKLPYVRGWGNRKAKEKPVAISLTDLNQFKANSTVNLTNFVEIGFITQANAKTQGVKVLNKGELTVKGLTIELPASAKAKEKIESAGGKVV